MGIGISVFLMALGGILAWGVNIQDTSGRVDIHAIGVVLMVVGAIGLAVTAAIFGRGRGRTVVHERELV